ncbi:hypothetical protein B0A55_09158 [Friedmanniomyces simplex]|uniref:Chitin-binding type-4 domain-containing protein n=1 Tax=Friedmanniomyces simplex TaxID=329884 RepID=A0A4U0WNI7_9PEZI|nr:hypothetical protein B0A55_09158 [Friedmanniomyces simplex]
MRPISILSALLAVANAHMQLHYPAPFNSSNNPYLGDCNADPYLQYPYDCCGPNDRWTYPCRGYISLLGTPQGEPTATWQAGSTQKYLLRGIGNHYGGSCQVGFSVDKGETFQVATSYEGNCPHRNNGDGPDGQDFPFTIPADMPTGVQVFAWIWYNREQEFNMNCAAVEITAAADPSGVYHGSPAAQASASSSSVAVAYHDRPEMLVADDGNGCLTPHTTAELKYPLPGPDVVMGDGVYPLVLPNGTCDAIGQQAYQGETGEDGH